VILDAMLGIAKDAVEHSEQFSRFDAQSSLLAGLADSCFANHLANFEDSARDRPVSLDRRMGALDQDNAIAFDDNGTHAD
jgi:hypothetical protein